MIITIITACIAGLFGAMVGYVFRNENDMMQIQHLHDEIDGQLITILKHEKTIATLTYVAEEREKDNFK